jgi:hypothetical protein
MVNRYTTWSQDPVVSTVDPKFSWLVPSYFPGVKQFDGEMVEFDIVEHGRRIAPFVSPMALGKSTRDIGYRTFQLKPAYIKLLDTVRPTQGFVRMPGEPYGGNLSPQERLNRQIAEKMVRHREMIETRWEAMAAEVLFTGKLTIVDDDYPRAVVDFERDANLDATVATLWNNALSDPMSDIQAIAETMNTVSRGAVADRVLMRSSVYDLILRNQKFRDSLNKFNNLSSNQNGGFEATGLRSTNKQATFRGTLGGQYDIWTYDGYYEDDTGAAVPFVPANKVLINSNVSMEGVRYHGAIFDMDANMQALEIFVKTRDLWNPSGHEVLSQSAPMLGMRRPNSSAVLTVI